MLTDGEIEAALARARLKQPSPEYKALLEAIEEIEKRITDLETKNSSKG